MATTKIFVSRDPLPNPWGDAVFSVRYVTEKGTYYTGSVYLDGGELIGVNAGEVVKVAEYDKPAPPDANDLAPIARSVVGAYLTRGLTVEVGAS